MNTSKTFESTLPEGYREVFHIDARNKRIGLILNGVALGAFLLVLLLGLIPYMIVGFPRIEFDLLRFYLVYLGWFAALLLYLVLHELTHGVAYKGLTGARLTFGLSWSCAFCGVPQIYTYRRTALVALLSPFLLFSVLFLGMTVGFYFLNPILYLASLALLGMHLGGCSGDLYMTYLLLVRFRKETLLMRDTGPEQWIYLPIDPLEDENNA